MQIRFSLVLPVLWLIQICLIFVGSSGCHDTETANATPPTSAKQIRKLIKRLSSSQSKEIQNTIQDLRKIGDPVIPALIQATSRLRTAECLSLDKEGKEQDFTPEE